MSDDPEQDDRGQADPLIINNMSTAFVGEYEVKSLAEKFTDVLFLHCRAFEESDAEDWPAAVHFCNKLNLHQAGDDVSDTIQAKNSWPKRWKEDSCHLLKLASGQENHRNAKLKEFLLKSIEKLLRDCPFVIDLATHMQDASRIQDLHRQALQDVWTECTIERLEEVIKELGPQKVEKLLGSLCIRIRCDSAGDTFKWYRDKLSPVRMVRGSFDDGPDEDPTFGRRWWSSDMYLTSVKVYYTQVKFLLEDNASKAEDSSRSTILSLSQSISNSGSVADQYNQYATPFGQAVTHRIWTSALPYFVTGRLWDVILQVLLSWSVAPVSHCLRLGDEEFELPREQLIWPGPLLLTALAIFGTRGILTTILDVIVSFRVGLEREFGRALFSPFIWFNLAMEAFSCYFVCRMCRDYLLTSQTVVKDMTDDDFRQVWKGTYLHKHPAHVFSLIWLKWFQLMLMVMNFNLILPYVLPVWAAISSPRSTVFLSYMVLLSVGTMLAYYALPVEVEPGFYGYFMALYRMCSLDLLGQFDDMDMAGENLRLQNGTLVEPEERSEFHIAIKVATIGIGILFPVILLNMYVGVLSTEHDTVMKRIVHTSGVYRSRATFQLLLGRRFWKLGKRVSYIKYASRRCWACLCQKPWQDDAAMEAEGTFIFIPFDLVEEYESSPMFLEMQQAQETRLDKVHSILRKFDFENSKDTDRLNKLDSDIAIIKKHILGEQA